MVRLVSTRGAQQNRKDLVLDTTLTMYNLLFVFMIAWVLFLFFQSLFIEKIHGYNWLVTFYIGHYGGWSGKMVWPPQRKNFDSWLIVYNIIGAILIASHSAFILSKYLRWSYFFLSEALLIKLNFLVYLVSLKWFQKPQDWLWMIYCQNFSTEHF